MTKMELLPADVLRQLYKNGEVNAAHIARDGETEDFKPVVKFFYAASAATWLITEMDEDGDTMFGLCDMGHGFPEIGRVSFKELSSFKGRYGFGIERDRHFKATKTLTEYANEARAKGKIVA